MRAVLLVPRNSYDATFFTRCVLSAKIAAVIQNLPDVQISSIVLFTQHSNLNLSFIPDLESERCNVVKDFDHFISFLCLSPSAAEITPHRAEIFIILMEKRMRHEWYICLR
jgi:hypothetical protein